MKLDGTSYRLSNTDRTAKYKVKYYDWTDTTQVIEEDDFDRKFFNEHIDYNPNIDTYNNTGLENVSADNSVLFLTEDIAASGTYPDAFRVEPKDPGCGVEPSAPAEIRLDDRKDVFFRIIIDGEQAAIDRFLDDGPMMEVEPLSDFTGDHGGQKTYFDPVPFANGCFEVNTEVRLPESSVGSLKPILFPSLTFRIDSDVFMMGSDQIFAYVNGHPCEITQQQTPARIEKDCETSLAIVTDRSGIYLELVVVLSETGGPSYQRPECPVIESVEFVRIARTGYQGIDGNGNPWDLIDLDLWKPVYHFSSVAGRRFTFTSDYEATALVENPANLSHPENWPGYTKNVLHFTDGGELPESSEDTAAFEGQQCPRQGQALHPGTGDLIVGVFQEEYNRPRNVHVSVTYEGNTWNFTPLGIPVTYRYE